MSDRRPNVILILADDMGFSDLGCFGSEIRTPNLDAMAQRGAALTAMYNGARCCPTRAALLTGLYATKAGVGHMGADLGGKAYQGFLRDDAATISGFDPYQGGGRPTGGGLLDQGTAAGETGRQSSAPPMPTDPKDRKPGMTYTIPDGRRVVWDGKGAKLAR